MKKLVLITTLATLASQQLMGAEAAANDKKVTYRLTSNYRLTSPMIEVLDGKSWAINGEVYGLIVQVWHGIKKMLYGVKNKDGKFVGAYEFEQRKYSIAGLAKQEAKIEADYFAFQEELINHPNKYTNLEKEEISKKYNARKIELENLLVKVKEDFKHTTRAYVEGARGTKTQILMLIEESCELRNKPTCFLLRWGETEEGSEAVLLDTDIKTFKEMSTFVIDLVHFLEDLGNSCDKAAAEFDTIVKTRKHHN